MNSTIRVRRNGEEGDRAGLDGRPIRSLSPEKMKPFADGTTRNKEGDIIGFTAGRFGVLNLSQYIRLCCGWTFGCNWRAEHGAVPDRGSGNWPPPRRSKGRYVLVLVIVLGVSLLLLGYASGG